MNRSAPELVDSSQGTVVIDDARLVDGTGAPAREHVELVIQAGRIRAINDAGPHEQPADPAVRRISARGMTVMPGLIDAHVHLSGQRPTNLHARYMEDPGVQVIRAAQDAYQLLLCGFTSARDCALGSRGLQVKRAVDSGDVLGPRLSVACRALSQTGGACDWHPYPYEFVKQQGFRGVQVDGPWEYVREVRVNFRNGADFTKVMVTRGNMATPSMWPPREDMTSAELQAAVETTHALGGLCAAHCVGAAGVQKAVDAGCDTIEHGVIPPDSPVLELLVERGTLLVPTLSVFHWTAQSGDADSRTAALASTTLELQLRMVRRAHELGVTIAAGTDTGSRLGRGQNAIELELLVSAGLSPMDAVVAGTRNAASALGWLEHTGTVAVGKLAELLLVQGHPDEDVSVLRSQGGITHILRPAPR